MTEQQLLLSFFILNWLLIIVDAALGYFVLPLLLRPKPGAPPAESSAVDGMRRLLTVMVTLYMLANCYAFFSRYSALLYIVSALVALDVIVQLVVRQRRAGQG